MTVGDLSNLYLRVEKDKYWYMDEELYNSVVEAVDKGYCRILNTKSPDKFMSAYNFWSYLHEKLLERDEYTPSYKKYMIVLIQLTISLNLCISRFQSFEQFVLLCSKV